MLVHLSWGRNGKLYALTATGVHRVSPEGEVATLSGQHHVGIQPYWNQGFRGELAGDWSAVAPERRGHKELWGLAWNRASLAVDETAAPIPSEGNEQPHSTGPIALVTDSQRNAVRKLQFAPTTRGAAVVSEFIYPMQDPWDIVAYNNWIIVSERGAHRVSAYDVNTGTFVKHLLVGQNNGLAVMSGRVATLTGALADARAQPTLFPEGLYIVGDTLYIGSLAQRQVTLFDLVSETIVEKRPIFTDGNSLFVKFAVDDGSFHTAGDMYISTWSNRHFGLPYIQRPDGTIIDLGEKVYNRSIKGWASSAVYPTAVAVGAHGFAYGGATAGIGVIDVARAGDVVPSAAVKLGAKQYLDRGLNLLHGVDGFGYYGLPLPFGVTPEIDAYLLHVGHTP